ncbi:MAG: hypothetical protein DMG06_24075 [Acidobacteria bacterium]|nr:MAG: hypothetical protein DMG06_24075 [Acidobacteriota bacterium]
MKGTSSRSRLFHLDGKGNLGCFFGLLMIGAMGYGVYKFGPPYVRHYQLKDEIQRIATLSAAGALPRVGVPSARVTPSITEIKDAVMGKARELGIPLHKQDIDVHIEEERVFIAVKYIAPIDLPWALMISILIFLAITEMAFLCEGNAIR